MLRIRNCIVDRDFLIQDLNLDFRRMRTDAWELDGGRASCSGATPLAIWGHGAAEGLLFLLFLSGGCAQQVPPCERYMA